MYWIAVRVAVMVAVMVARSKWLTSLMLEQP